MKRPKRSGMLVTSSMAYARPSPGIACYSAVKKFATHMAQGLNLELAEKVDVMSYNPFGVATKLIKKDKSQAGGATITVEQAVEACFRDMGCNDQTDGAFVHEMVGWLMINFPKWMIASSYKAMMDGMSPEAKKKMQDNYEKAK